MADIIVNLKLAAANVRAQAQQAGEQIREAVQGKARKTGASPLEWIAQQNANKAAGGKFQFGGGFSPGPGGGGGGIGAGGAAAIGGAAGGVASIVAQAVGGLIRMMAQAIRDAVVAAFREAASLYSKRLTSGGLSGGLVTSRSLLAEVIGVGEREVWQYGSAVAYLNKQIRLSTAELNRNVRPLTAVTWSWKLMNVNMRAYFSQLMAAMAPAFKQFADLISAIIEFVRETGLGTIGASVWRTALHLLNVVIMAIAVSTATLANVFVTLYDTIVSILKLSPDFAKSKAGWDAIGKMISTMGRGNSSAQVPNASVSYNRMQASPWERMGLVIGQGAGNHPLRATERNTRKTAEGIARLISILNPRGSGVPKLDQAAANGP